MRSGETQRALRGLGLALALLIASPIQAQTALQTEAQRADLFDFWVGDWDVAWVNADGSKGHGRNRVAKILDGKVLEENFEEDAGGTTPRLLGRSLSVLNAASGQWQQAWADNQGGFFALHARLDGERRMFVTDAKQGADGKTAAKRMVFHTITPASFTWDWEDTSDGGQSWKRLWRIEYRRR